MPNTPPMPSGVSFDPTKLADIQLPNTIGVWPPALGWWLLLLLIIVVIAILTYFIKRKPPIKKARIKHLKSQAMIELESIKKHYQNTDGNEAVNKKRQDTVKSLSIFLRRYALSLYNRDEVASLTDQQWLHLLDDTYNYSSKKQPLDTLFSEKYADLLTQVPYQPNTQDIDPHLLGELLDSSEILIQKSIKLFNQTPSLEQVKNNV